MAATTIVPRVRKLLLLTEDVDEKVDCDSEEFEVIELDLASVEMPLEAMEMLELELPGLVKEDDVDWTELENVDEIKVDKDVAIDDIDDEDVVVVEEEDVEDFEVVVEPVEVVNVDELDADVFTIEVATTTRVLEPESTTYR
jgi:hypothetical protein